MFRGRKTHGFTLLELIIVVAIIGLIAALMIPNLLSAIQKAKQKRTMAEMRNVGTAWMSWVTDQLSAASAASSGSMFRGSELTEDITYVELYSALRPTETFFYMQEVPQFDAWHYSFVFAQSPDLKSASVVAIASGAADGNVPDLMTDFPVAPFAATDFVSDIVWSDGYFVTWPDNLGHSQ